MTRERIEDIREIVLPFVRNVLLKTNYENLGKSDAEEFTRDFNEILDLATKALEQEPTDKSFTKADIDAIVKAINEGWELRVNEILSKIRAEIEQYQSDYDVHGTEDDRTAWRAFNRCLQILDKYKAESEG